MPVDSSIYGNLPKLDIMGNIQSGMKMRDMMDERAIKQADLEKKKKIDDVYKSAVVTNPDGSKSYDQTKLSALAEIDPKAYRGEQKEQMEMTSAQMKSQMDSLGFQAQLLGSSKDQASYTRNRQKAIEMKIPGADKTPEQYDKTFVDGALRQTMTGHQQVAQTLAEIQAKEAQQNKDRDYKAGRADKAKEWEYKDKELGVKKTEAEAKVKGEIGKLATDIRKERSDLPVTKDTQKVSASFNRIQKAAQDPSAAGDLALIFNYMKMLDPGSTVREGEFANAQNAAGVPDQIRNMYERIRSGQRLNPAQRDDFINKAGGQYQAQLDLQNQADQTFFALAERAGIDPKDVLVDFQANKPAGKKPPPISKESLAGMSREEKIAEATRRGLLGVPEKQVAGGMSMPRGGGG